ncbi:MAG: hypothetical protein RSC98_05190 [Clostridia bacterium]
MPKEIYEVVAQGARYWFVFLMALIVWRSYRWYRRDRRQRKKRLRLLPDAGFVGEMVVVNGGDTLRRGTAMPVPREGTLGLLRTNDLCVPITGVANNHLWFRFDDGDGLMVEPFHGKKVNVDGEEWHGRREPLHMAHGSRLYVGEAELRLRLFAGFEAAASPRASLSFADGENGAEPAPKSAPAQPQPAVAMTPEQVAAWQQAWMQQQAYQQWLAQQWAAQAAEQPAGADAPPPEGASSQAAESAPTLNKAEGILEAEQANAPQDASTWADARAVQRGARQEEREPDDFAPRQTVFDTEEVFYPLELDGEAEEPGEWPYAAVPHSDARFENHGYTYPEYVEEQLDDQADEDQTDAAMPPKSAYIGDDEAAHAKEKLWDKVFGGGRRL